MTDFLLYDGRHGEQILVEKSREGWDFLITELERDDGSTLDESRVHDWVDGGTYEKGYVRVDDGGCITTISLTIPHS